MEITGGLLSFLPFADLAGNNFEQRVRFWDFYRRNYPQPFWIAPFQFPFQMLPLVKQLPARFRDFSGGFFAPDFLAVKFVAATHCFIANCVQKFCQSRRGILRFGKADELRMMFIAARPAAQNFLRQQRLAPKRDKSLCIEIFRMNRPKPHFG